jgi:hypothetical protein
MDSYNHSIDVLRELIVAIAIKNPLRPPTENLWCTNCFQRSIKHGHLYNYAILEYGVTWIACKQCFQSKYLVRFDKVVGFVGNLAVKNESHMYIPFWHAEPKTTNGLDRPVNQMEIHPGLGEKLEWALVAIINEYANRNLIVPPIHLLTDEPISENTRRLIAPYVKGRLV